jgi:ketosteroid isomerase-like protein
MKKQLFIIILTVLCAALTSVAQNREARTAVEENEAKFSAAFARGDAQTVSDLYAETAAILPPNGARVEGRANIKNFWQGAYNAGVKKVETKTLEVEGSGNTVSEIGSYTLRGADDQILDEGKYVVVWKKEGKNWQMFRDIWNSNRK